MSQELEELQLWSLKRQQSLMALGGGRGWWALSEWEDGVHWAAEFGVGLHPGGGWVVLEAKPRPQIGLIFGVP